MNRLCVYMTYNRENAIYEYIGIALKELKKCCSKIYLVCNYEKIRTGMEYVVPYTEEIFYRPNKGYDSGAYKDVLRSLLGWEEVYRYDELLLVNDSFFGFFYPLEDSFKLMDREDCDFWGMTGQTAGAFQNPAYKFDAHIHSYFFVFKKKVFHSRSFRIFWEQFSYPENFREAIVAFEIGLNAYLRQQGFFGVSYIDACKIPLKENENPCYSRLGQLVKDHKVPIMKKKCVLIRNPGFKSTLNLLRYLEKEDLYPIHPILTYLENQFYIPGMGDKPCNSLEIFYKSCSEVYLYGAGVCGKNLDLYFRYKGWVHSGFIVTDREHGEEAMNIEEADIRAHTGIIISVVNEAAAADIERHIGERCKREQLFFISQCRAIRMPE